MRGAKVVTVRASFGLLAIFAGLCWTSPIISNPYYTQGKLAFSAKKYNDAMELFRKALQADPSNGNPLFYMGYILENTNKKEDAIQAFSQAVDLRMDADLRDKSYWKIIVYYKYTEDWENLYTYTSKFLQIRGSADVKKLNELAESKRDPALKEIMSAMREADAKKKSGDLRRARKIYQHILAERGDYQSARWQLVLLDMKEKDYRAAQRNLEDLVRRNSTSWEYQYKSGVCATILGEPAKALRHFAESRRLNEEPDDSFKFFILLGEGTAQLDAGSYTEARQHLTEALKKKKTPALLGSLARVEFESKRSQPAQSRAAEALALEADEPDALAVKGLSALERGAGAEARADLIRMRKRLEKDIFFPRRFQRDLFVLGQLYCDKDDWHQFKAVGGLVFGEGVPSSAAVDQLIESAGRFLKGNNDRERYQLCRARTDLSESQYASAAEALRGLDSPEALWLMIRAQAGVGDVVEMKRFAVKLATDKKDVWPRMRTDPLVKRLMEKSPDLTDWIKREGREKEAPVDKPKEKPEGGSRPGGPQ